MLFTRLHLPRPHCHHGIGEPLPAVHSCERNGPDLLGCDALRESKALGAQEHCTSAFAHE